MADLEHTHHQDVGGDHEMGTEFHGNGTGAVHGTVAEAQPPPLLMNKDRSKFWFRIGVIAAVFDLCIMPVVYYFAFTYGTKLTEQESMFICSKSLKLVANDISLNSLRNYNRHFWHVLLFTLLFEKFEIVFEKETCDMGTFGLAQMGSGMLFVNSLNIY